MDHNITTNIPAQVSSPLVEGVKVPETTNRQDLSVSDQLVPPNTTRAPVEPDFSCNSQVTIGSDSSLVKSTNNNSNTTNVSSTNSLIVGQDVQSDR